MKYSKKVFLSFLLSFLLGESQQSHARTSTYRWTHYLGLGWGGGATLISAKGCHASNDLENVFNFSNRA